MAFVYHKGDTMALSRRALWMLLAIAGYGLAVNSVLDMGVLVLVAALFWCIAWLTSYWLDQSHTVDKFCIAVMSKIATTRRIFISVPLEIMRVMLLSAGRSPRETVIGVARIQSASAVMTPPTERSRSGKSARFANDLARVGRSPSWREVSEFLSNRYIGSCTARVGSTYRGLVLCR